MSEPSLGRIQRNSSIELLRIIAILMIVLHHASVHSTLDVWSQPFCLKRLFSSYATLFLAKSVMRYFC